MMDFLFSDNKFTLKCIVHVLIYYNTDTIRQMNRFSYWTIHGTCTYYKWFMYVVLQTNRPPPLPAWLIEETMNATGKKKLEVNYRMYTSSICYCLFGADQYPCISILIENVNT